MKSYEKGKIPHVLFGSHTSKQIGKELKKRQIKHCLIVSGKHIIHHPNSKVILQTLDEEDISYDIYDDVSPEPTDTVCMDIAHQIRIHHYDCILGIGGGSPMDAAKAGALIAGIPEPISDLHDYGKSGHKMQANWKRNAFLVLVPTTSGSGAETTASAVITSTIHQLKFSFGNENIAADLCVIDPTYTLGMPKDPTINGGLDALSHTIEILVGTQANEYTNAILYLCLEKIWKWLPIAVKEPENLEAREQLAWASHNALANGGMPNGHAIAHALGSEYHIVHGRACAMVLPSVIRHFSQSSKQAIEKIAKCMGVSANDVPEALLNFYHSLGVSMLKESGCTDDKETFIQKMIPAIMDDFKSKEWLPPIHTGDYQTKIGRICAMIYDEK